MQPSLWEYQPFLKGLLLLMKKQIRSLIIGLVVVAALVVVLLLLLRTPDEEEPSSTSSISNSSSSSESNSTVSLLSLKLDDIQSLEIRNTEEYTIVRDTAAGGENEWVIEELAGLPKVKNSYGMFAIAMCSLSAKDIVGENVTDLAQYGLDPAASTVTVVMKDGTRHTIEVGNDAPGGSSYTYVKLPGSNTVYLCSSGDIRRTRQVKTDYISMDLFTLQDTSNMPTIMNCVLGGTSRKEPMVIERVVSEASSASNDGQTGFSDYQIMSPRKHDVNTQVFSDVMETAFNTSANEIVAYNITDEQLAQYGLDEPYNTLDLKYKENEQVYEIHYRASEPDSSGAFYLMLEGVPVVYRATINLDYATNWMNIQYQTMASRLFILPFINDVKALTVETPDGSYRFDLTVVGEGTDDEKLNVHYNGKALTDKNFKKFYQVVIGPTTESLVESEEGLNLTQPLLTYTYEYVDTSKKPDVVSFYKGPTRQVYVSINGECEFTTRDIYIDKVYSDVVKMINDEEVITDW